jgi:hypothetical protein
MSVEAIAGFLTVRGVDFVTVVKRVQNYWPGQTVDQFQHYPFATGHITSSRSGGQSGIEIRLAISKEMIDLIEAALLNSYVFELRLERFTPSATDATTRTAHVIASSYGELVSASYDESSITLSIGSSLDPVEAQAPPRKFTTRLVGTPPQL